MNNQTTSLNSLLFKFQKISSSFSVSNDSIKQNFNLISKNYRIRKVNQNDDYKIRELIQSILLERGGLGIDSLYYDKELNSIFDNYKKEGYQFNVLTKKKEIVGSVGIGPSTCSHFDSATTCEIKKLYLHKDSRNLGYGKALFIDAFRRAKKLGYKSCTVTIENRNEQFSTFLINNGFEIEKTDCGEPHEIKFNKTLG